MIATASPLNPETYGLMAEFESVEQLVAAIERTRASGFKRIEAYTPIPSHAVSEALGQHGTRLPWLTFIGGVLGAITGFVMQYYASVDSYPLNIGGRPLNSWPAFVPIVFEMTILTAALFTVLGMLALNGLPMPYHPVFNVPQFKLASRDRFFLCIEARDAAFDPVETRKFLHGLHPEGVYNVPL